MGSIQEVKEACGAEWRWRSRRKVEVCVEQRQEEIRLSRKKMSSENGWEEEEKRRKEVRIRANEGWLEV